MTGAGEVEVFAAAAAAAALLCRSVVTSFFILHTKDIQLKANYVYFVFMQPQVKNTSSSYFLKHNGPS